MAITTYTYSISNDMPDGSVNTSTLHDEIVASSITIALDSVDTEDDDLEIVFKAALPAADKVILDGGTTGPAGGLLLAHDNSPSVEPVQVVALDSSSVNTIELQEAGPGKLIYHNFAFDPLVIPADSTDGHVDLTLPFDFWFLSIEHWAGTGSGAKLGDRICAAVDPKRDLCTLFGAYGDLETDASAGQDTIQVFPGTIATGIIQLGYILHLGDSEKRYQVAEIIDKPTGMIRLADDLETDLPAGTKIYRTICLGYFMNVFPSNMPCEYGQEKTGASKLPAGWAFRIYYVACDSSGREIRANVMGSVMES